MKINYITENDIWNGFINNEFRPFLDPIVHCQTECVIGYALIARWDSPHFGIIPEEKFNPILNINSFGPKLMEYLLLRTAEAMHSWPPHLKLFIKLPPQQLMTDDLYECASRAMAIGNISPNQFCFELSQIDAKTDLGLLYSEMNQFTNTGFSFGLNGLGSGTASLNELLKLPFHTLKISSAFTRNLELDKKSQTITRWITGLGGRLGLQVIAENIENQVQVRLLHEMGCQFGSGPLFSEALSLEIANTSLEKQISQKNCNQKQFIKSWFVK